MKLFLIKAKGIVKLDHYIGAVVCAKNEDDAKKIHPEDGQVLQPNDIWPCDPNKIHCTCIGTAAKNISRGSVLSSFLNA